jgi:hypothetical protein
MALATNSAILLHGIFNTVQSWLKLFTDNGFKSPEIIEPLYPEMQKAASIIFIGQAQE